MTLPRRSNHFLARPHPHLYEIHTWAWLEELSRQHGRTIALRDVPDSEWDALARLGFDFIWLMGIWERSPAGRKFFQTDAASFPAFDQALPGWKLSQIVGSPYAIRNYAPDARIGAWGDLDQVREKLHARRMGLILDFVPNHTALDHPWTTAHPEYYIRGTQEDFRSDPGSFHLAETAGEPLLLAHGRDPYFSPWRDVAQLNYFSSAARAALLGALREIARHADGVRCDMAMLVLNEIHLKTWGRYLAGFPTPQKEFWTEAVAALPGFVWLAEVYWGLEERMQDLGFQFTYDKDLYDALRDGRIEGVRGRLGADPERQSRFARFLENHDEARSAAVFGAERREAAATLIATLPGMRFYHHGQLDGRRIHLLMPLAVAAAEKPDAETRAFYETLLRISNEAVFHEGRWQLLELTSAGDDSYRNFVAYEWRGKDAWRVVAVNLGGAPSQARLRLDEGISPAAEYIFFDELHNARYPRRGEEIASLGLYIRRDAYRAHLFDVTPA